MVHGVQNTPMHRLQPVAHVRQRASHDYAHGVIEIGVLHGIRDINRHDGAGHGLTGPVGARASVGRRHEDTF